jgi:hypothetical protein
MFHALVLATALSTGVASPCDLASAGDVLAVLGRVPVAIPSSEIGEETAPMCLWATAHRAQEIKLSIWSTDELPVLDLRDAESYFVKLEAEAHAGGGLTPLDGMGVRAFATGLRAPPGARASGTVVVLKNERLYVFDYSDVVGDEALAFAARMTARF